MIWAQWLDDAACKACDKPIRPGHEATWRRDGYAHTDCVKYKGDEGLYLEQPGIFQCNNVSCQVEFELRVKHVPLCEEGGPIARHLVGLACPFCGSSDVTDVSPSPQRPGVTLCAWCPDPHHPDPARHPGGRAEHVPVGRPAGPEDTRELNTLLERIAAQPGPGGPPADAPATDRTGKPGRVADGPGGV